MQQIFEFLRSLFAFAGYLSEPQSNYPPKLMEDEERLLIEKLHKGDEQAREKLIVHNMRLCAHIAKKYARTGELDDFISIGSIGLIKGVNTFNNGKGKLSSYLSKCVENEILMYLRSTKKLACEVSLGESLGEDKDGNSISLIDILCAAETTEDKVELKIMTQKLIAIMDKALTKREKSIIYLRYGLNGSEPLTQIDIAKKLGISRSYVSRIEKKALSKLKKELEK